MLFVLLVSALSHALPDFPDFSDFANQSKKMFTPNMSHQVNHHLHHPYLVGSIFLGSLNANTSLMAGGIVIVAGGALVLKRTDHLLRYYIHQEKDLTLAPSFGTVLLTGSPLTAHLLAKQIDHPDTKLTFPIRPDLVTLIKNGFVSKASKEAWLGY